MTERHLTKTAHLTAKQAFRGCRAIIAAVAVIACGLFAAPLQADHITYDATVTLTATLGDSRQVTLNASVDGFIYNPSEQTGFEYRMRQGEGSYSDSGWMTMNAGVMTTPRDGNVSVDLSGDGPFHFQARAWNMRQIDGEWHLAVSDPSAEVTVELTEE